MHSSDHTAPAGGAPPTFGHSVVYAPTANSTAGATRIRILVEGRSAIATLMDVASSKDFVSMFPLSLTLERQPLTQKVSALPRKLSIDGAPSGYKPSAGDLSYDAPRGHLAVFYIDSRHSEGLVKLGRIYSGMERLGQRDPITARLELVEP